MATVRERKREIPLAFLMVLKAKSTPLSPSLSLSPANAQHKPNRESKKKTILLPTISQCVSSFAYDHVVSGRDVFTHLSKKSTRVAFSPFVFASHVFLKNTEPPENGRTIQIIFKKSSLLLKIAI